MNYQKPKAKPQNPSLKNNPLSKLFFLNARHIIGKGIRKELTEDDVYEVHSSYKSKKLGDKLEREWEKLVRANHPVMAKLLWRVYKTELLLILSSLVIPMVAGFLQQNALKQFIMYFTKQGNITKTEACFHGFSLVSLLFINALYFINYFFNVEMFTLKMRAGFISLIYRKLLKLDTLKSPGQVINLITRDVNEFEFSVLNLISTVREFANFVMVCCILGSEIGWLFLILVVVLIITVLPDASLAFWIKSLKLETLKWTDQRYQLTKEVLNTIKLLKMCGWTERFNEKICGLRKKEVFSNTKINFWIDIKRIFAESVLKAAWYIVVTSSILFGSQFNAGTLFLVMSSINLLQRAVKTNVPLVFHEIVSLVAVFTRIGNFLRSEHEEIVDVDFAVNDGLTVISKPAGNLLKSLAIKLGRSKSVSYASQEPWIFPSTVRQNILFGNKYDEQRYTKVLKVCGLDQDLKYFPEGDKTLILDRGANLSKGQQVRINLARAVYKNSSIYLLDGCLSSLDNLVAAYIFKECILGFLKEKTVIITTQINTSSNVVPFHVSEATTEEVIEENFDESSKLLLVEERNIYHERKTVGKVKFSTYRQYVCFGGTFLFLFVCLLRFPIQILKGISNKFESTWVEAEQVIFTNATNQAFQTRNQMIYLLPVLWLAATTVQLLMTKAFWVFGANAAINLHRELLEKVSNATMRFFDRFWVGTVLNRFSEDLYQVDENLPRYGLFLINGFVELLGLIFVIATVNPVFLVPCVFLSSLLLVCMNFYLRAGRALKRMEFASRSPMLGYLSASVDGLLTIKTSRNEDVLREEFDRHLDFYTFCFYFYSFSAQAFSLFVHICGVFFIVVIVVVFLILDGTTSGDVGLVLSQAMMFVTMQHITCRGWVGFENTMTTVERTLEFTRQQQEGNQGVEVEDWPKSGEIKFENASFAYNGSKYVYRNLDFVIKSGEKVALVGRSGSGKTSLMYTLMRLYNFEGKINIDGVDITTVPLDFLRSKISVVPQDPILFTGSLRENIDPAGKYTDDEVWRTVKSVKLSESLNDIYNLSVGQKQLLCLCRALLRRNRIVIIDELTANVDDDTETLIQETIERHFASSTVVMITHKLKYVLRYDKVLVLDQGQIVEFDSPSLLLQNQGGLFYSMYHKQ